MCVQSVVADNRGNLWVLDPASPGNEKVIAGGPKLVRIELATNKVAQVIHFGEDVALQGSYLNDVRFHPDGNTAFITDSGARGAIVVVDLESGRAHARLDGHPSTQPEKGVEVSVAGQKLQRPDGRAFQVAADGIALSGDGRTLYWQALTGRTLYRVDTAALMSDNQDDAAKSITKVGTTNVADGLLMSRDGWLYLTSPEDNSIKLWTGERTRDGDHRSAAAAGRTASRKAPTARSTSLRRDCMKCRGSRKAPRTFCRPNCSALSTHRSSRSHGTSGGRRG